MSKALTKKPVDALKAIIHSDSVQEQFKNAMGKHSDKFVSSLITVFTGDERLQQCEPSAVIKEALKAAVLSLPIEKSLGYADIIPYKDKGKLKPNFQVGYKGWIQLAKRSGQIAAMNDGSIYEGESVKVDRLSGKIEISGNPTSDKAIGYFAYFEEKNGCITMRYWTKEKMIAHAKKYSAGYKAKLKVWVDEFDKMASKSVLTHILKKYAPKSVEFLMVGDLSDMPIDGAEPKDITPEPEPKTPKPKDKKPEPKKDEGGNEIIEGSFEDMGEEQAGY